MRELLRDKNRLEHMLEQICKAEDAAKGFTFEQFCNDPIRYAAISYFTMIIGEAAYMITKEFKESHPLTPWRQIEGMRHHIVHGYYQVRRNQSMIPILLTYEINYRKFCTFGFFL